MTDWNTLAAARGLHLPQPELEKLAAAIEALEQNYRRLSTRLTHDIEPATTLTDEALEAK